MKPIAWGGGIDRPGGIVPGTLFRAGRTISFRADPNLDANAVKQANAPAILSSYRDLFGTFKESRFPYRLIRSAHTGLPTHLNAFLHKPFDLVQPELALELAQNLLQRPETRQVLFGRPPDSPDVPGRVDLRASGTRLLGTGEGKYAAHVRFQQYLGELPVLGGEVVVHLTSGTRRASVTSSYFPLKSGLEGLQLPPDEKEAASRALKTARTELAARLAPADCIDLCWEVLAPSIKGSGPPAWADEHTRWLRLLGRGLLQQKLVPDTGSMEELVTDVVTHQNWDRLRALATQSRLGPPHLAIVPYAGENIFVFPFQGRFYLAYRIEYVPRMGTPWRVFVNAVDGKMLGEPEALALFSNYYPTSESVPGHPNYRAGEARTANASDLSNLANSLRDFVRLFDVNCNKIDLTSADDESTNVAYHADLFREHMAKLADVNNPSIFNSFTKTVSGQGLVISPSLEIDLGFIRPTLAMGFLFFDRSPTSAAGPGTAESIDPCAACDDPDDLAVANQRMRCYRRLLEFQSDPGNRGIPTDDGTLTVFTPSLDPEVIYHEMAHWVTWMLNPSLFDQSSENVPFWRALSEGSADYFARSFAARSEPAGSNPENRWASAAFRNSGTERALSRADSVAGEDFLAIPDLYPEEEIQGAGAYHVGMIWARALWQIRQFFGEPPAGAPNRSTCGVDDVDRWALHAIEHLVGWTANFDDAAEGLLNEMEREELATDAEIKQVKTIFASRGIYADRGIQALASTTGFDAGGQPVSLVVAGSDAGLGQLNQTAISTGRLNLDSHFQGGAVVALAFGTPPGAGNAALYAATKNGAWCQNNFPNGNWAQVGAGSWPAAEIPVSMAFYRGLLFVGTAHKIYFCDTANPDWLPWDPPSAAPFAGLAFNLCTGELPGSDGNRYAVCLVADLQNPDLGMGGRLTVLSAADGRLLSGRNDPRNPWVRLPPVATLRGPGPILSGRPTAVALAAGPDGRTNLYVGTLGRGVWRQEGVIYDVGFSLASRQLREMPFPVGHPGAPATPTVYCLALDQADQRTLYAGTSVGIFVHDLQNPASGWTRPVNNPPTAIVRHVLPAAGAPILGTFDHDLQYYDGRNWQSYPL